MMSSTILSSSLRSLRRGVQPYLAKFTEPRNPGFWRLAENAWETGRSAFLFDMLARNSAPDLAGKSWFRGLMDHYTPAMWCRDLNWPAERLSSLTIQVQFDLGSYRVDRDAHGHQEGVVKFLAIGAARDHRGRLVADTHTGWARFHLDKPHWVG